MRGLILTCVDMLVCAVLKMSLGPSDAGAFGALVSFDGLVSCAATEVRKGREAHNARSIVATIVESMSRYGTVGTEGRVNARGG